MPGFSADSVDDDGVLGVSSASGKAGVAGVNESGGNGVYGRGSVHGLYGHGAAHANAVGVAGVSDRNDGVRGYSSEGGKSGVAGVHQGQGGHGVWGTADNGRGVVGLSKVSTGVFGRSEQNEGVRGESANPRHGGVVGVSHAAGGHGIYGTCDNGTGVVAVAKQGTGILARVDVGNAAVFDGDVQIDGNARVSGDIQFTGADCAEQFHAPAGSEIEPGTVMVIAEDDTLHPSSKSYDRRVAGVVSGGGQYRPALVLDASGDHSERVCVALMGKAYCKVDAQYGPINIGDPLTASPTAGHAMRASDPTRAFGAVLGKALRPLPTGRGSIPVLVTLQ